MLQDKKVWFRILGGNLILLLIGYSIWFFYCKDGLCSSDFRGGFLEPAMTIVVFFILSLTPLFFVKSKITINWLKYVVSWYMPVAILFVSQTKVYTSSVMSIDRTLASVYWMLGLFVITLIFVAISVKGKEIKSTFFS
ncbi:MAG: hypothetical protein RLZZ360_236 [Candidatus Parcubacteria bacterium]|jgi:hypothetical protein